MGNFCNLLHVQFSRKYHDVGELCVKLQSLDIADVELCAQVHFLSYLTAIKHHRHVARNDGTDASGFSGVEDGAHQFEVLPVDDGVDGQVAFDAEASRLLGNPLEVVDRKRAGRVRTHVQVLNTKVDAVGTGSYGSCQALGRAHRRHYLYVFLLHFSCKVTTFLA